MYLFDWNKPLQGARFWWRSRSPSQTSIEEDSKSTKAVTAFFKAFNNRDARNF